MIILSSNLNQTIIVTDQVFNLDMNIPSNTRIVKLPAIGIPKLYGATKILFFSLTPVIFKDAVEKAGGLPTAITFILFFFSLI
jgi:hypothetical protein